MFYIIYKVTNNINNKIYIGKHQTLDVDDGYMGSGVVLKRAFDKYGLDNFTKDILHLCESKASMDKLERDLVDITFIARDDTYNVKLGGEGGWDHLTGTLVVKDDYGNAFSASVDDPRYVSGELISVATGRVPVKDSDDNRTTVSVDDPRYVSGELVSVHKGSTVFKDSEGNILRALVDDPRYLSGEITSIHVGYVIAKDADGNYCRVPVDDPRYLSGELVPIFSGCKHSDETKRKIGEANSKHQSGVNNSQYGTRWVYNKKTGDCTKINGDDVQIYLDRGWALGKKAPTPKRCKMCGQYPCDTPNICSKHQMVKTLIEFFDFDENTIGSVSFLSEYSRVVELLNTEYHINKLSVRQIQRKYGIPSSQRVDGIFKSLGVRHRSRIDAVDNYRKQRNR